MDPLPPSRMPSLRSCVNGSARLISKVAHPVGTSLASYGVGTASQ
ncbi:hypothetical protein [Streptomyces griseorubiginosus]